MAESTPEIETLDQLRAFVLQTVCATQQLLPETVRVNEQILLRQGKTCGIQFTLAGPRAVQFSAIWDAAGQTILFYDSNGLRFDRRELNATARLAMELDDLVRQRE